MIKFNLKEAAIFQAVKWARHPAFRFARPLKKLFLVLFIILFLIFLYGFLTETFTQAALSLFLGLSIIFLTLTIGKWVRIFFLESKLKKPKLKAKIEEAVARPEEYNLAEFLSFEVAKAVFESKNNSTGLFYHLLSDNPELNFVFFRAILSLKEIKKLLNQYLKKIAAQAEIRQNFRPLF